MVYVGACGYSYAEWVGPFYPEGLAARDYLAFYAQRFPLVEVDYTYYRMPTARTLATMAGKTPPGFLFAVKATASMTHEREADAETFAQYRVALAPLVEAGKLACVLAQFPWSFRNVPDNRAYLARLREELAAYPVVVEFRHGEWIRPEVFGYLRELGAGYCCVDQPRLRSLVPPVAQYTGEPAYVRFHGRNAAKWWRHDQAGERYDYLYSEEELGEWVARVRGLAGEAQRTLVAFNNHYAGQAIQNAQTFTDLLTAAGLAVASAG